MIVTMAKEHVRDFVTAVIHGQAADFVKSEVMIPNWEKLIESGAGRGYGLVIDDKRAGFLFGLITDDLLSGEKYAFEYLWIVWPEYRSGAASLGLLKQFEADAKQAGCKKIFCGARAAYKLPELRRMYPRLGYSSFSESFMKELKNE